MPKNEPMGVEVSFEAAMERLEKIVEEMESSKLPLEELLVRYEEESGLLACATSDLLARKIELKLLPGLLMEDRNHRVPRTLRIP